MAYNRKDYFFKKAKKQGFAARSIFKLEEIDQKYKIISKGDKILDLGAAPGSWSQYASQKIGEAGRVLGLDLQEIGITLSNAKFIQADIRKKDLTDVFDETNIHPPFDVVLSDMAPKTTGIKVTDQARSLELCELALENAERYLKPSGNFCCKLFHAAEFNQFRDLLKSKFKKVEVIKPKSTRKESKEIFLIGLKLKNE